MFNQAENWGIKIFKNIFATICMGLVVFGLVSCDINQQASPPQIERPTIESEPSPTETDQEEDEGDEQDEADEQEEDTKQEDRN
ncbi:hypothetical protein [Anabaena sp. UHCC 0399]|uniref:hypothetical protein n=1 Tax=Anabaena sp. UHCC 0399 TaxID=3110238 RepID=UPI002B21BC80|nr:hypothetical protein [Anabaena sp. UHCC 0399]MEA5565522.1 hypothetical protein [Anabaena sp. UHCC 0399]